MPCGYVVQALIICAAAGVLAVVVPPASAEVTPEVQLNLDWSRKAFSENRDSDLPFSFAYGGRPSREIVGSWKRSVTERKFSSTARKRTLTLSDPTTGLEVRAVVTIYTDTPGVDWTIHFANKGTADTPIIEQVKAVHTLFTVAADDRPVLHRMKGSTCSVEDFSPVDERLPAGKSVEFGAQKGRSSAEMPFFNIQYSGGGVVAAIGWSGQWRATVERRTKGIRLRSGMEFLHTTLHPGESIRSPRVMLLFWRGSDEFTGCNLFRKTMFSHIMPRIRGKLVTPIITNSAPGIPINGPSFWQYYPNWTEGQALSELEAMDGLGFEYFWIDAYFLRDSFPAGVGNYGLPFEEIVPDPVRFPHGLKPLSEAAHKQGLKFLLWFEPERVHRGSYIAKNHPEWVIWDPTGAENGMFNLLDLGNPEARDYVTSFLMTAIKELGVSCLRIDFNLDPLPRWQSENAKDPNRVGISEIRHVEGLYKMWDEIRAAFPDLFIDDCASGGRRIDLETCSRSIPLWRTDVQGAPCIALDYNQASIQNQAMAAALSRYVPFSTAPQIIERPYDFRSGWNGGIVVWSTMAERVREVIGGGIAEGKRIRKYWLGNFYPLSKVTVSPKDWLATQYHLPESDEGIVTAFRRHEAEKATFQCHLRGIDPKANYTVTRSYTFVPEPAVTMAGTELAQLALELGDKPASMIVEYERQGNR